MLVIYCFIYCHSSSSLSQSVYIGNSKVLAPVVQTLDSAIHWINHYPLDNSIGFASVYLLDSNLSGGQRYPSFEQLGPGQVAWKHNTVVESTK